MSCTGGIELRSQGVRHHGQRPQRGRQDEGPTTQRHRTVRCQRRNGRRMTGLAGFGKSGGNVQARIGRIVERAAQSQLGRIFQPRAGGEPCEFVVVAQGGRREDPGLGRTRTLLAQHVTNVQRRLDQPRLLRTDVDPAHPAVGSLALESRGQTGQRAGPLLQLGKVGAEVNQALDRHCTGLARGCQALQCLRKSCGPGAFLPAQLDRAPHVAQWPCRGQAQLARRALAVAGQCLPVGQAARLLQADGKQVAGKVDGLRAAQRGAEKLHAGLDQLMGLVEHRRVDARKQFCDAAVAQRHVGEEQVVIDHHHVGGHRLAPCFHDVAGGKPRAVAAQAVLARRRDQRNHRRTLVEAVEFGKVAADGGLGPGFDACQRTHGKAIGQQHRLPWRATLPSLIQAMQAQIAGAPLQQRQSHRHAEGRDQARQVAQEQLILQALGGGADHGSAARQQQRHQVGECLADAGASLGDQRAALVQRRGDGQGKALLHFTFNVAGIGTRQRSGCGKRACNRTGQHALGIGDRGGRHQAGSGGSTCAARWAIWSRSSKRRFFSRRSTRSSSGCSSARRSIRLSRSACSMRSSIRRRWGECRLSSIVTHTV